MKAYITKYALTQGIIEVDDATITANENMIVVPSLGLQCYFHGEGREWHRTKEKAIVKANELRDKKLKSIEKQIDKIKSITFN